VLTFVCWKWKPRPGVVYRSKFEARTVIVLRNMIARHYAKPHRFVCVTDDATGLGDVETLPLWSDHATVVSPHGTHQPSCYRRLKAFSPEARDWFGDRFVSLDLDTVIVGDVTPLFDRTEDFIIWKEQDPRSFYNGSMWMMTAGARRQVWDQFDPKTSPTTAKAAGRFGSDQGWLSYCLGPNEAKWTQADGVYSYRLDIQQRGGKLPKDARITMWHGGTDPWSKEAQRLDWVRAAWQ
jgi:hypothetical protein